MKQETMKPFKGVIPNRFSVAGVEHSVTYVNDESNYSNYGELNSFTCNISLQKKRCNKPISDAQLTQTFWHEVVHSILDVMGEENNEKFVYCFSGFLNEVIQSCEVDEENDTNK